MFDRFRDLLASSAATQRLLPQQPASRERERAMTFFLSGFIFAVLLGTSLRVACSGFILTNMASRFETPFKPFPAEGPDLSYDFLKEFFK